MRRRPETGLQKKSRPVTGRLTFDTHDRERNSYDAQLKPLPHPGRAHEGAEPELLFEAANTESSLRVSPE